MVCFAHSHFMPGLGYGPTMTKALLLWLAYSSVGGFHTVKKSGSSVAAILAASRTLSAARLTSS